MRQNINSVNEKAQVTIEEDSQSNTQISLPKVAKSNNVSRGRITRLQKQ